MRRRGASVPNVSRNWCQSPGQCTGQLIHYSIYILHAERRIVCDSYYSYNSLVSFPPCRTKNATKRLPPPAGLRAGFYRWLSRFWIHSAHSRKILLYQDDSIIFYLTREMCSTGCKATIRYLDYRRCLSYSGYSYLIADSGPTLGLEWPWHDLLHITPSAPLCDQPVTFIYLTRHWNQMEGLCYSSSTEGSLLS